MANLTTEEATASLIFPTRPPECSCVDGSYLRLCPFCLSDTTGFCALTAPTFGEFDAIAVSGASGLIIGAPTAMILAKHLIVVRKPAEPRHSSFEVEGLGDGLHKYIILDDEVSSGKTIKFIKDTLLKEAPKMTCAGVLLYSRMVEGIDFSNLYAQFGTLVKQRKQQKTQKGQAANT